METDYKNDLDAETLKKVVAAKVRIQEVRAAR